MKRRNSGDDTDERRKCMEQKLCQYENEETGEVFQINNLSPNSVDTLDAPLMEYLEENKKENQSKMTVNSVSLPSSSLMAINGEQKIDGKVNTCCPEELNSEEEKTKSFRAPGYNLAKNTCRTGTLQPAIAESCCLLLSRDLLQSSVASLTEVPKYQTREQEAELKRIKEEPKDKKHPRENEFQDLDVNISKKIDSMDSLLPTNASSLIKLPEEQKKERKIQQQSKKKEAVDKPADGTSIPGTTNSTPLKKLFQSLGDTSKFDALMRGEFVLDINEIDFLLHPPGLNRPTNEGEEQNAENMEESNDQKRMKARHKLSEYQLGILKEHFNRNKYIKPAEVQVLSKALNLTPQQIQHWFCNQRYKMNKCASPVKGASNIQAPDGIPARSMNNSTPLKEIFQNSELRWGDVILKHEENDFLPQTPALNRFKNEDEEEKAENIEASDNQTGSKTRHKLSGYQLQILSEYFHRNQYIRYDDVQVLSRALSLTPQTIRFWFSNQRKRKKKFEGSFNRT